MTGKGDWKGKPKKSSTTRVAPDRAPPPKVSPPRAKRASKARAASAPAPTATDSDIAGAMREADALFKSATEHRDRAVASPSSVDDADAGTGGDAATLSTAQVEERIRELESRLDAMIDAASQGSLPHLPDEEDDDADAGLDPRSPLRAAPQTATEPSASAETLLRVADPSTAAPLPAPSRGSVVPSPPSSSALAPDAEPTAFDTARELLSTNYYLRKWGRLGLRNRSEEVDDFGYDPVYEKRVKPFLEFLYSTYFRVETSGVDRIPSVGRCLLVANHSGTLPFDGLMIRAAVKRKHAEARDVRWLAEDFIFHFPFIGSFTTRIGAVRACQENAERLLRQDALVAVFPEGMKGTGKLFRDRYRLQRFGRGGFVKLALRTQTPIVPVAVLGGEETQPLLARLDGLGKPLGFPYVPITPLFPLLGPLGLAPAPTKWRIVFGEPIRFKEGPECADDELLIGRLGEQVRGTIQEMVDELVSARRSVFFG